MPHPTSVKETDLRPIPTATMLELIGLRVADRVLDVAAGTGDSSLMAARRVGPSGHVLTVDISANAKAHDDAASPFYYMSPLIENLAQRSPALRADAEHGLESQLHLKSKPKRFQRTSTKGPKR